MSISAADYDQLTGRPIQSPDELETTTREKAAAGAYDDAAKVFYSSSEQGKAIPYSADDLDVLQQDIANALETMGLHDEDYVIAAGAPPETDHQSGWGLNHGAQAVGATVVMTSRNDDPAQAVEYGEDVTAAMSLPRGLQSLGREIEDAYGDLADVFPHMRLGITGGDRLTQPVRDALTEQWGFDAVRSMYVATEPGAMAAEDGNGDFVPTTDSVYMEVLEDDADIDDTGHVPEDAIHPVHGIDEAVTGPLLVSVPDRDIEPLYRLRLGDVVTAYPGEDGPRLRFEGREDDVINLSGHHLYPAHIEDAVRAHSDTAAWRAVVSATPAETVLDVYLIGDDTDFDVVDAIAAENPVIDTWYDGGGMEIRQHAVPDLDALDELLDEQGYELDTDLTARRKEHLVAYEASYDRFN